MRMDNGGGARLSVADRPRRGATVDQSEDGGGRGLGAPERSVDFRALHALGGLTLSRTSGPGASVAHSVGRTDF